MAFKGAAGLQASWLRPASVPPPAIHQLRGRLAGEVGLDAGDDVGGGVFGAGLAATWGGDDRAGVAPEGVVRSQPVAARSRAMSAARSGPWAKATPAGAATAATWPWCWTMRPRASKPSFS
jgi:hypothetical protein